jgi:hypothetical protein
MTIPAVTQEQKAAMASLEQRIVGTNAGILVDKFKELCRNRQEVDRLGETPISTSILASREMSRM